LVDICGYELPTNLQNFMEKDLTEVKIFQKVWGGLFFLKQPVLLAILLLQNCCCIQINSVLYSLAYSLMLCNKQLCAITVIHYCMEDHQLFTTHCRSH